MSNAWGWDAIDPFDKNDNHFWIKIEHLGRYLFAADIARKQHIQTIADISTGTGFGIPILEESVEKVIAVDRSDEELQQASHQRQKDNTELITCDLEKESLSEKLTTPLEMVVCFETLEHLINPIAVLSEFHDVLESGGVLILSVPNQKFEAKDGHGNPKNAFHKQLYTKERICKEVEDTGFIINDVYGQYLSNTLFKREQILKKRLQSTTSQLTCLHEEKVLTHLAYLLAYPNKEGIDGSYSYIIEARKQE